MIAPAAILTDSEISALTIAPGFSTADRVTSVSGRGTVVTLKIPLTLAIIDGLLVESGAVFFVVPLANISECIEMDRQLQRGNRDSLVGVRGELVAYLALRQRFALPGEARPSSR